MYVHVVLSEVSLCNIKNTTQDSYIMTLTSPEVSWVYSTTQKLLPTNEWQPRDYKRVRVRDK